MRRPPLGVMPHRIWVWKRCLELMRAILQYEVPNDETDADNKSVPIEFVAELKKLLTDYEP